MWIIRNRGPIEYIFLDMTSITQRMKTKNTILLITLIISQNSSLSNLIFTQPINDEDSVRF